MVVVFLYTFVVWNFCNKAAKIAEIEYLFCNSNLAYSLEMTPPQGMRMAIEIVIEKIVQILHPLPPAQSFYFLFCINFKNDH